MDPDEPGSRLPSLMVDTEQIATGSVIPTNRPTWTKCKHVTPISPPGGAKGIWVTSCEQINIRNIPGERGKITSKWLKIYLFHDLQKNLC